MELPPNIANLCRVCSESGHYDLCETTFRCNEGDIMLIEAFNCFSTLKNDCPGIYLCKLCTESLTSAYSFWQQIKRSDEKFLIESHKAEQKDDIESDNILYSIDTESIEDLANSEQSMELDDMATKNPPTKRKIRKTKQMSSDPLEMNDIKIGISIALPHFIIASADDDENNTQNHINGRHDIDADSDSESHRKRIKTLKPSAVIPPDLDKINELCMSPLEFDGDSQSIYKCSHCPKAFAAPHHLMIHMRKSHMCQYCLATFSKINDLYSHVKEVHRTFDCLLCDKEFQTNGNLRQHMRKNHSIFLPAHISLLNISDVSQ